MDQEKHKNTTLLELVLIRLQEEEEKRKKREENDIRQSGGKQLELPF